jgi:NAD(P)-dependent dehydrogenase (short-subunit alcohol dehydrogenase family)
MLVQNFAVEGLTESIAYELEPFGIKVVLIEPGFIKTNFANSMVIARKAEPRFTIFTNDAKIRREFK